MEIEGRERSFPFEKINLSTLLNNFTFLCLFYLPLEIRFFFHLHIIAVPLHF